MTTRIFCTLLALRINGRGGLFSVMFTRVLFIPGGKIYIYAIDDSSDDNDEPPRCLQMGESKEHGICTADECFNSFKGTLSIY